MFDSINLIFFIILLSVLLYLAYLYFYKFFYFKKKYNLLFKNTRNNIFSILFIILTIFILLFWIFDFKWWEKKVQNELNWLDIVFVLDVSKSMNALFYEDWNYYYSWLDTAKTLMSDFVSKHLNDRFGLVIFAWDAISSTPLTTDHSTFLTFLENVDYRNLNEQWTNIEKAIKLWVERFNYSEDRAKVMIVITDWADEDVKIDYSAIEWYIEDKNISNYVIWIWTNKWWKIPVKSFWRGNITYQKYKWKDVVIKINKKTLLELAKKLDWQYLATDDLNDIDKNLEKLEKNVLQAWEVTEKASLTRYIALLAFIFFIFYFIFSLVKIWKNED